MSGVPLLLSPEFKADLDFLRAYAQYDARLWEVYGLLTTYVNLAWRQKEFLQDEDFTYSVDWVIGDFFRVADELLHLTPGTLTKDLAGVLRDGVYEFASWAGDARRFFKKGDKEILDRAEHYRLQGVAVFEKARQMVKELETV